jgi:hypothetical protein
LNDDFYKKLLDITKSIISSSRTIQMNESILFDNNKIDDKEMTPQIKSKKLKIFETHPNDILNKLNQKCQCHTNYLKCKYNSHNNSTGWIILRPFCFIPIWKCGSKSINKLFNK